MKLLKCINYTVKDNKLLFFVKPKKNALTGDSIFIVM